MVVGEGAVNTQTASMVLSGADPGHGVREARGYCRQVVYNQRL